ncbi:hypothetical protein [Chryseobacterium jejuense]|uniref:hypothetical protein n=1 Tax=Chryseobacterium jejuense TaxID=445960 RepID=UPI001AE4DB0B|nr:hypothetical protein [Chryseobacterium jejuense]MBP2616012.1 hypothetical protein [Chryseobacterium jejuense]
MSKNLYLLFFLINIGAFACSNIYGQIKDAAINSIHSYSTTPVYSLQMNKQGCKLVVEMENNVDYRLTENRGESIMLPLNVMITKSGEQTLKIKIYPKDGDQYITKYAHVKINIFNAPDKSSSLKDYKKIAEFTLPEGLESQKLPFYEHTIDFDATVPFDYSKELDKAVALNKIPNIEELVVKKYNEVRTICGKSDVAAYTSLSAHSAALVYNATYTDIQEVKNKSENQYGIVDSKLKNRTFIPIENYYMQFYANNKIVALWQRNHNPLLYLKGENSAGKVIEGGDPLFLYMPEGSNELKAW